MSWVSRIKLTFSRISHHSDYFDSKKVRIVGKEKYRKA